MKLRLSQLLKNASKWVSETLQGIADAEDRFVASMFEEKDKDDSNKG
jgi:hypothetical protein